MDKNLQKNNKNKEGSKMTEKKIMLGNEAIARGAYEAGVKVSAAYPGTPSTEISENIVAYDEIYAEWSPNEKVATELAIGASMSGVRAMASMKHVGLNVAADPLYTASYIGANGGLMIVVADDPGLYSSQNEQDTRAVARAALIPVIEPSDSQEAKDFVAEAMRISEEYDTPVIMRTTTRLGHSQGVVELKERVVLEDKPYERDPGKNVMMPGNAIKRHLFVEDRMNRLEADGSDFAIDKAEYKDTSIGFITSGIPYQYVKEVFPNASILKLGMVNPLPKKLIEEFASKVDKLYIIEELEPVIEEQVRTWGIACTGKDVFPLDGEYSANMLREKPAILLRRNGKYRVELGDREIGNLIRIDHFIDSMDDHMKKLKRELNHLQARTRDIETELAKDPGYVRQIEMLRRRLEHIDQQLGVDKNES